MYKCNFCETSTKSETLPRDWGSFNLEAGGESTGDIIYCPFHRQEVESSLGIPLFEKVTKEKADDFLQAWGEKHVRITPKKENG